MTLARIVKKTLVPLGVGVVVLAGIGTVLAASLEQWQWVVVLLAAGMLGFAAIGVAVFLRQGELLRLQRREAARDRRVEERRRRFERGQLPNRIDDSVQRALRLLGDRSDLRTDLLEETVLSSVRVIRDDIARSVGGGDGVSRSSRLSRDVRQQLRAHEQVLITELDALHQIHRRFPIDGPLPLVGGWALSPTGLLQLLDLATAPSVRTVVECGSGVSTIYLAWVLRDEPGAKLISLEHEPGFARVTRNRLRELGLESVAQVRLAPLETVTIGDWSGDWYALDSMGDLEGIDLLLVDGPPRSTGEQARYPALPILETRMSEDGIIVLDDADRPDEREVLESWCGQRPWTLGESSTKRQAVLQRDPR